jgi:hypothetical protein
MNPVRYSSESCSGSVLSVWDGKAWDNKHGIFVREPQSLMRKTTGCVEAQTQLFKLQHLSVVKTVIYNVITSNL